MSSGNEAALDLLHRVAVAEAFHRGLLAPVNPERHQAHAIDRPCGARTKTHTTAVSVISRRAGSESDRVRPDRGKRPGWAPTPTATR